MEVWLLMVLGMVYHVLLESCTAVIGFDEYILHSFRCSLPSQHIMRRTLCIGGLGGDRSRTS